MYYSKLLFLLPIDQQSLCFDAEKGQSLKIKKRIKEFQKKHLLAAHEALWGVLGEMKAKGEVCQKKTLIFLARQAFSLLEPRSCNSYKMDLISFDFS